MTAVVASTDFCRNFGTYQRRVQREPIEVRNNDKVTGYFVSPDDFARVQTIIEASRKAYHPSELPEHLKQAISNTRMDERHNHLNALMDGE